MSHHHADQQTLHAGADPEDAAAGAVLVHGRGASARSILGLTNEFDAEGVAYLAPQAANRTWYPNSFTSSIESNEPQLSSALRRVGETIDTLTEAGIPRERILLVGFSQGACLASEYVARNAERYGGLAALSGGLIGPEGTPRNYDGDLDDTPAFVGCSDSDPHIPLERVHETTEVLEELGADVTERIYPDMPHTVNEDEQEFVAEMVAGVADVP
ncbi:MAG: alpha/beta hydrolase [Halobacteriaceae archaeon]